MDFETWRPWFQTVFLDLTTWDYVLLAIHTSLTALALIRSRQDFKLSRRQLILFIGLVVASLPANHFLVLSFPRTDLLPPIEAPIKPIDPFAPLLGALPIFAAGAWLGAGPATLVGLVGGVLRLDTTISGVTEPFRLAALGFLVGSLLHQDYRGTLSRIGRQPLAAALVAGSLSTLLYLSSFGHVVRSGLAGFAYALTLATAYIGPTLLESLVAAAITQAVYLILPHARPVQATRRHPPYSQSLRRRLSYLLALLMVVMTFVLVYAVTTTTLKIARAQAVSEVSRDGYGAVEWVPYFIQTGHGLLDEFASDERFWYSDPTTLETILGNKLRAGAFFDQLLLFDPSGYLIAVYPPPPTGSLELTSEEKGLLQRLIENGSPLHSSAHLSNQDEAIMSFLAPVDAVASEDEVDSPRFGALIGRTHLDNNPIIRRILSSMQWASGQGEGFLIDGDGLIVAHSNSDLVLTKWRLDENSAVVDALPRGTVYESYTPKTNERLLVYYLQAEGHDWAVVIRLPYKVVMEQAWQTAYPLLQLQIVFGCIVVGAITLITRQVTRPLKQLADAADRIAEGDLARPVRVKSEDEVGRVGTAFEGMRVRLKGRIEDLSLLLAVSRAVSATLDLSTGMPYILEGALRATGAQVARVVLLPNNGEPQTVISRGEPLEGVETLDRALAAAIKSSTHPLIIENLSRARNLADPETINGPIKAVVALPMRTKDQLTAAIWVGYDQIQNRGDLESDVLAMLSGQAAILVENANLFQAAESGRRRLAAILHSTIDAVIVTDRENRVLLVNPAAEHAFEITAESVIGREVEKVGLAPALAKTFRELPPPGQAQTEEVSLPDGRTLYASVSTISGTDGEQVGRVAVMHDITRLKELDEMKSEFLATVSHDLRSPLMFMRGYANMLLTMSELDDKQREYVKKILYGVVQINELVSDLLDLGRIETGVRLEHKPCHLGVILTEAVDSMRAQAVHKEITLQMEPIENPPIVAGDAALLRQAIANLVDNAIKYTPGGGVVTVGLSLREDGAGTRAVIRVADTGIGIAPKDQVRLFEKFHRVKRRDAPEVSGTGLGLAIVKSIVERHEGKVWVDSAPHEGSTFYISLPLNGVVEPRQELAR
ncbi:MAG: HAMP domain-containing protein [Anaerolineae bacterium]|nr:HAMP domain-containing protein [Anaerolineae bacterium]